MANPPAEIDIALDGRDFDVLQWLRIGHLGRAVAGDGRGGPASADDARRDKHMHFIDQGGVEQRAEHFGATFDQQIGHPPPAEFVQQSFESSRKVLAWRRQHLDAGRFEAPAMFLWRSFAGRHNDRRLAGRAHKLAFKSE